MSRRSLIFFRIAALVGVVASGVLLPMSLLGVAVGVINLVMSLDNKYFWAFVPAHLALVGSGTCGLLGFIGFTMAAFSPWRALQYRGWVKRSVVSALCFGMLGAAAVIWLALSASGLSDLELPSALFSLALLAFALILCMTANPSIERMFQRPLRALWPAAHVER